MIKHLRGFKSGQSGNSSQETFSWLGDRLFLVFWETIPTRVGTPKGIYYVMENSIDNMFGSFSLSNFLNFTMYEDMFHLTSMRDSFMRVEDKICNF